MENLDAATGSYEPDSEPHVMSAAEWFTEQDPLWLQRIGKLEIWLQSELLPLGLDSKNISLDAVRIVARQLDKLVEEARSEGFARGEAYGWRGCEDANRLPRSEFARRG